MPAADDVVQQIGGLATARQIADLVEDQKGGRRVLAQASLEGGQRLLLEQVREGGGKRREAHGVAALEGEQSEILGEHRLADAAGASEQNVVPLGDKVERGQLVNELALDRALVVPVEAVERLEGAEGRRLRPRGEVAVVAFATGERDELLEGLHGRQARGGGMRDEREQRFARH